MDHNDWLIGYMDHNDYDSGNKSTEFPLLTPGGLSVFESLYGRQVGANTGNKISP